MQSAAELAPATHVVARASVARDQSGVWLPSDLGGVAGPHRGARRAATCTFSCCGRSQTRSSAENQNLGRYLDPNEVATKSWKKGDRRKPLSPMYQRMVIGYGVDVRAVKEYARQSKKVTKLRHGECR